MDTDELLKILTDFIVKEKKYCSSDTLLEFLGNGFSRSYLSYRNINVTRLNRSLGFERRKLVLKKPPNISKEEVLNKMRLILKERNEYTSRDTFHRVYGIYSNLISFYDIDVFSFNLENGFYKDSPQSKFNKQALQKQIIEYINSSETYVSQNEISEVFKISIPFITKWGIDTVALNLEKGLKNPLSYFEDVVFKVLSKYFSKIIRQHSFKDCRSKKDRMLKFDFFVDDFLLVEADGAQHYDPDHIFFSKVMVENDNIKQEYVESLEEVFLIRIPYSNKFDIFKSTEKRLLESLESLVTTAESEMINAKVRKALELGNQQPSL